MIYVTYKRKQITNKHYIDPVIDGLISNLPYSNPLNDKEFIGIFDTENLSLVMSKIAENLDFDIELVDNMALLLDSWYGDDILFIDGMIEDNRELDA